MLTRWLRPHQREGVQFMFDCVCGLRLQGGQGERQSMSHNPVHTSRMASKHVFFEQLVVSIVHCTCALQSSSVIHVQLWSAPGSWATYQQPSCSISQTRGWGRACAGWFWRVGLQSCCITLECRRLHRPAANTVDGCILQPLLKHSPAGAAVLLALATPWHDPLLTVVCCVVLCCACRTPCLACCILADDMVS
jgi:hypothetical protein